MNHYTRTILVRYNYSILLRRNITKLLNTTIILLTLFLCSCSSFFKNKNIKILNSSKTDNQKLFCKNKTNTEIISQNKEVTKEYINLKEHLRKQGKKLSITEELVLFSLLQMNFSPHISAPSSRLITIIKQNDQIKYFDYEKLISTKHPNTRPDLLVSLSLILKHYNSKHTLTSLASFIDSYKNFSPTVSKEFSKFIFNNKATLETYPIFAKTFFRGDRPLKPGDHISTISYSKMIKQQFKKSYTGKNSVSHLFDYPTKPQGLSIKCNYDFNLYKHSIYPIADNKVPANTYGIQNKKGDMFLATSFQDISSIEPMKNSFLIKGTYPRSNKALCITTGKQSSILLSTKTRDPGQILYNFIEQKIIPFSSKESVISLLKLPRHYLLMNPKRMIFETEKASKEQIDNALTLRFPVYHQRDIGEMYIHTTASKSRGFILDPRSRTSIYCR